MAYARPQRFSGSDAAGWLRHLVANERTRLACSRGGVAAKPFYFAVPSWTALTTSRITETTR